MSLLLVTVPAIIGAIGTVVSVYVAGAMRTVKNQTNGRLDEVQRRLAVLELRRESPPGNVIDLDEWRNRD